MKLDSKYFDRIRTRRKREAEPEPSNPVCQWDGCDKPGAHRAPVGRHAEGQFFLFGFEHVKDYTQGYNYFSGLSDTEIARYQKEALTGHRPTWTVGVNKAAKSSPIHSTMRSGSAASQARMKDPFGFVQQGRGDQSGRCALGARQGRLAPRQRSRTVSCPSERNCRSAITNRNGVLSCSGATASVGPLYPENSYGSGQGAFTNTDIKARPFDPKLARDYFAKAGFTAMAPALFDLVRPDTELRYDAPGVSHGRDYVAQLGFERALKVVGAAARWMRRCPKGRCRSAGSR